MTASPGPRREPPAGGRTVRPTTPEIDLADGLAQVVRHDPAHRAFPAEAAQQLSAYIALLAKWNRVYNLTAIREPARMVTHHVLDSLATLPHLPNKAGLRLLDVGSGAGVPAIPLAVARPDWHVVAIDSNGKKSAFVRQAVSELALTNVETITGRVEDYAPERSFDVVISRAFADLQTFAAAGLRHLVRGGVLAAMKGEYPADELSGLATGARLVAAHALDVPGLDAERHLILLGRAEDSTP